MGCCFSRPRRNERESTLFSFPPYDQDDEREGPSCCQSIKDCFKKCFLHYQCIAGFDDESEDDFFDPSLLLPESEQEEEEENPTQNPNMETGTSLVEQVANAQVTRNPDRERSDSLDEKRKRIAYMWGWGPIWGTEVGRKVARTGADESAVAQTRAFAQTRTGADGSAVAGSGIDDSAALRKDKGPSSSKSN